MTAVGGDIRHLGSPITTGTGFLIGAELGAAAAAVRTGAAVLVKFRAKPLPSLALAGLGLTATYVRVWDDEEGWPNRNYLGPELHFTAAVNVRVGWLFPLTERNRSSAGRATWHVGIGF